MYFGRVCAQRITWRAAPADRGARFPSRPQRSKARQSRGRPSTLS